MSNGSNNSRLRILNYDNVYRCCDPVEVWRIAAIEAMPISLIILWRMKSYLSPCALLTRHVFIMTATYSWIFLWWIEVIELSSGYGYCMQRKTVVSMFFISRKRDTNLEKKQLYQYQMCWMLYSCNQLRPVLYKFMLYCRPIQVKLLCQYSVLHMRASRLTYATLTYVIRNTVQSSHYIVDGDLT